MSLIKAVSDQESYSKAQALVDDFLMLYKNTHATLDNYTKEINRLLFFLYRLNSSTLENISMADISGYLSFLESPPPECVGPKKPFDHPDWKPLNKPLAGSSIKQAKYNLNVFLEHLVNIEFIKKNPIRLLPKKIKTKSNESNQTILENKKDRYFKKTILNKCIKTLDLLADVAESKKDTQRKKVIERYKFIIRFYYLTMVRISEFASLTTLSINHASDEGVDYWYLDVVGKGSKQRQIPISEYLKEVIEDYHSMSLLDLSHRKKGVDYIPLILPLKGNTPINAKSLSSVVKSMFYEIADHLDQVQRDRQTASLVRTASSHWLRHTGGSHLLGSGVDIVKTRDILGHQSVTTTNTYLHVDSGADLHKAISNLKL